MGHVQVNQQLLVIYLYLFHKNYYKLVTKGERIKFDIQESDNTNSGWSPANKIFENNLEKLIYEILDDNGDYPSGFYENKQAYHIFEAASNLSTKDAELILEDKAKLRDALLELGDAGQDFYSFYVSKYHEWYPYTPQHEMMYSINKEEIIVNDEIKKVDEVAFDLLSENKRSKLIDWIIVEFMRRSSKNNQIFRTLEEKLEFIMEICSSNEYSHLFKKLDLSQTIYFLNTFADISIGVIYKFYQDDINNVLNDDVKYSNQKRKSVILYTLVIDHETSKRYPIKKWGEDTKKRISNMDDENFISFWKTLRIINVDIREDNSMNGSIRIWMGDKSGQPPEELKEYNDLVDFFINRLESVARKKRLTIYYSDESMRKRNDSTE